MSRQIDSHDRMLLDLLARDARTTSVELAGYIGETSENVLDRISWLASSGYIAGYRAVRGYPDPAEQPVTVLMFVERDEAMSGKDVLRSLRHLPELVSIDVTDEEFDLLVRLHVASAKRIAEIEAFFRQQVGIANVTVIRPISSMERH